MVAGKGDNSPAVAADEASSNSKNKGVTTVASPLDFIKSARPLKSWYDVFAHAK
jgi:hypothetical protein